MKPDAEGYYLIPIFSGEQTRGNHTYDDIAKAVRAACSRGPIPVTMGPVPTNEFELRCVDPSRICGIIKEPKFLEESEIIQGLFKATPGNQQFIDNLLSPNHHPSLSDRAVLGLVFAVLLAMIKMASYKWIRSSALTCYRSKV